MESLSTTCVIAGGGPAGMMLGYLLARAGIDVTVLEKHADFLRDFRGDTVHPSTLQVMHELGLLDEFLKLPHAKIFGVGIDIGERHYRFGDLTHLPTACKFIAMMPQWDFLDFLARKARAFPNFHLLMQTEAKDLIAQGGKICGVLAAGPGGNVQIRAGLTVAADGRTSTLRAKSGLKVTELGAPFDVLWLRLPFRAGDPVDVVGRLKGGQMFVMLYRGDYWQCALVIPKGGHDAIRAQGLSRFKARLKEIAGFAADRVDEAITDFDQVKLLTVAVNRLEEWARPGLLCIGDAAHAMSPVGGVGINLAIQDAVATANILGPVLQQGVPKPADLKKVQKRRQFPTRVIQGFQLVVQNRFLSPMIGSGKTPNAPWFLKLFDAVPYLRRIPARMVGMGPRPEHVELGER
ncbi:MAG: FAD-dependent oxidoreductase [Alphaproteobacteria bacterium]|nr:FAD-dependent oxidoreductase [Alphaproteobacteria bacterium]